MSSFAPNVDRVDRDWLWHELTEHAYWAKYRTRDMFEKQLDRLFSCLAVNF